MTAIKILSLLFLSCSLFVTCFSERISDKKCKEYEGYTYKLSFYMAIPGRPTRKSFTNKCKHNSAALVVGGEKANLFEFPHQALLGYKSNNEYEWFCGGSLVSSKFVLTAAYCVSALKNRRTIPVRYVKVGMNTQSQDDRFTDIIEVEESIEHPQYTRKALKNDIALLKLKSDVYFNEYRYPICLPTSQPDNVKAILTGFGHTSEHESVTQELMKVPLERFSYNECKNIIGNQIDEDSMLCFGNRTDRGDACRGDSGGPLQVANDDFSKCTYKILGVTSFSAQRCGTVGGVYVNVYHYLDWIERIVWENEV